MGKTIGNYTTGEKPVEHASIFLTCSGNALQPPLAGGWGSVKQPGAVYVEGPEMRLDCPDVAEIH